jgi:pyruvate dehydrogenase E1 component alpha subunit
LLEFKTYRFLPHYPIFEEDRPKDEIEAWRERDPLTIHGRRLKEEGLLDVAAIKEMDRVICQELEEALEQAAATPPPDPQEVFQAVYAEAVQEVGL